jgi:CMP-N,N'-diacetyllegionaminic acid synthase
MNILITICARGGSKGVPRKNIRLLNGKPLIAYSIEIAKKFSQKFASSIALSTDDEEIKIVAEQFGVKTDYYRPDRFSNDVAGKVETIEHLLLYEEEKARLTYDYILDLDVSAPMRTLDDLFEAFELLIANNDAYNLFSVSPPHKNPYFNMVELSDEGYYKLVKPSGKNLLTRQSAPKVYDINASFYFYRRTFFDRKFKSVLTEKAMAYVVNHMSFDIDETIDFEIMEFLVTNNKLDFKL